MIKPKSPREKARFIAFMRMLCDSIQKRSTGYRNAVTDVPDEELNKGHCHTAVARYVRRHASTNPDAVVVIVGSDGYYDVAHSLVVDRAETAILADTMEGHFEGGKYVVQIGTVTHKYHVYAAYKLDALMELSQVPYEDFVATYEKLSTASFKGLHIPRRGKVLIEL